jgi:hypothetical protein
VPPVQCPSCGRFLKNSFVVGLADAPAPCPGCGTELTAEQFDEGPAPAATGAPRSPSERGEGALHGGGGQARGGRQERASSVRPPDLPPDEVRDAGGDVLRGWDTAAPGFDDWQRDRPPFPTDTVIVAGAGLAGALLGATLARDRRAAGAAGGAAAGVAAAAIARRLWRLET